MLLQRSSECVHLLTLIGIRQRTAHGAEIVGHMGRVGGAGDDGGDARIAQQIFQEKLRPGVGEGARPVGDLLAAHRAKEPRPAERQSGKHGGFDLRRRRQDALFGFAVVERIVDLHEIGLLAQQHGLDRAEVAVPRRGDADVAAHALRLPVLELGQRLMRIAHIVKLQEIELLRLQARLRALELGGVRRLRAWWR